MPILANFNEFPGKTEKTASLSFLETQHFYVRLFLHKWTRQGTFWLSLLGEIYGFLQSLISISHLTGSSSRPRRDEVDERTAALCVLTEVKLLDQFIFTITN